MNNPVKSREVFHWDEFQALIKRLGHWDEFQALIKRLGVEQKLPVRSIKIDLDMDGIASITMELLGEDIEEEKFMGSVVADGIDKLVKLAE